MIFPSYKTIPSTLPEIVNQIQHTRQECNEALDALTKYGKDSPEFLDELMDITHSNETSLRMFTEEQREESIVRVIAKNFNRGYYREEE